MFGCTALGIKNIDIYVSIYRKNGSMIKPDTALSLSLHTRFNMPAATRELSNDRNSVFFLLQGVAYCLTGGRHADPGYVEFKLRAAL